MPEHNIVVRKRPEHCISRRDIDPDALKVLYRLLRKGFTAYLVGGGVRDLLLQRHPKDFDISTSAKPGEIKPLFRNCFLIGRRFRLAHIKYGDKIIETSTFRGIPENDANPDDPEANLFQKDDNKWGTPEEDAIRRDFTINGLFYDIETFNVIDYVGGLEDLEKRQVRCIGDPEIRFREDPVRMMRAVRFASRLGFEIEANTLAALKNHASEIEKASPPRMIEEIFRLFGFGSGEAAIRLLHETGLMVPIMPKLAAYLDEVGGEASLWQMLAALDKGEFYLKEATQPLMMATLFQPLIEQAGESEHRIYAETVSKAYDGAFKHLKLPRRMLDIMHRITVAQQRFSPSRKRGFSRGRFMRHETFPEALSLFQIISAASGSDGNVAKWVSLYEEFKLEKAVEKKKPESTEGDNEAEEPARKGKRRSRRRGGRSRRGKKPALDAAAAIEGIVSTEPVVASEPQKLPEPAEKVAAAEAPQLAPLSATEFYLASKKTPAKKRPSRRGKKQPAAAVEPAKPEAHPFDSGDHAPHWLDEI